LQITNAGETCCENNYGALNSKADSLDNGLLCGLRTRFWEKSLFTVADGKTCSLRSKRENGANISIAGGAQCRILSTRSLSAPEFILLLFPFSFSLIIVYSLLDLQWNCGPILSNARVRAQLNKIKRM
jgi:hypothetical protein